MERRSKRTRRPARRPQAHAQNLGLRLGSRSDTSISLICGREEPHVLLIDML